jgi:2-polyprenyl-3-methyl-5-hydroxy-6-metoxy-1,4-benzoquinol methylase
MLPSAGIFSGSMAPKIARFRRRAHAWWEGYIEDEPAVTERAAVSATGSAEASTAPRINIAEMVWGDGFTFPGGVEHVVEMVKPMALNPKKSMLYLGAGLGGGPRAIAKTFGTWTTGLEASKELAETGMAYSTKAGLAKKALIKHFQPATMKLPANKFDAVCARHVLSGVQDPIRFLSEVAAATRPEGHFLISDFAGSAQQLRITETGTSALDLKELAQALEALNFDVRVAEDMTAQFRELVVQGWSDLSVSLAGKSLAPDEARGLAQEINNWQTRLAAFASGELRVIRLYAIKKLM